jgi:hypothetical protein
MFATSAATVKGKAEEEHRILKGWFESPMEIRSNSLIGD